MPLVYTCSGSGWIRLPWKPPGASRVGPGFDSPQIHEKKSLCVVLLYSCAWVYTSDMTKTAFTTRKYQVIDFDDIQVGDWIQRKTPTSARFSNTYLVKSVSNFTVGATTWTIVECGQTSFFRHHETSSTFRKVL